MSELTSNYNLIKPQAADRIDLLMTNPNWDTIDEKLQELENQHVINVVFDSGAISFVIENDVEYCYSAVTSLTMTGAAVRCHGFITFGSSTPTIAVTGFDGSSGDDITSVAASEIWEFSVDRNSGKAYIIWKNWSA